MSQPETIFALQSPFGHKVSAWWVDLDAHSKILDPDILTTGEIGRAERMIRPLDARRFLASRHALRTLLASYVACRPQQIRYRQTESGKPLVVNATVEFSLSRSQGYALIACSRHRLVGADIEVVRPVPERDSLIESAFSDAEKQAIQSASATKKDEAFLRTWVRKEACLKATGLGLALPLSSIIVCKGPERCKAHVEHEQDHWQVEVASSESPRSTVAALAVAHIPGDQFSTSSCRPMSA